MSAASTTSRTSTTRRRREVLLDRPLSDARATWSADNGYTLVVSWTHGRKISEVNAGLADACLEEVGARFAAWNKPVLLRIYWEFNGDWLNWSGSGETFISAWMRTVSKIRAAGGTNVGFVWSPASGYRDRAFASYPGDEWVD
jgi:beta-mannanase